ncbi:MAG: hypothetical protein ACJZ4Z_02310 [Candidatus Thalassarchaeaceae archaeon]
MSNLLIVLPIIMISVNSSIMSVDAANNCEVSIDSTWDVDSAVALHNVDSQIWFPTIFTDEESGGFNLPLTKDFVYEVDIEDGGATAISMKLVAGYRYNFCITFSPSLNSNSTIAKGDVYLMTKSNWDTYRGEYNNREYENMEEIIDYMPVEWRDMVTWIPFRDVHSYEGEGYVQFSVGIDSSGSSWTSIFGDDSANNYYLVLDDWDNSRPNDFRPTGGGMNAEILVEVEKRIKIPAFTAYMLIGALPLSCIVIPIILHFTYKRSAKEDKKEVLPEQMPYLEENS